jgi:hypothetical protein
VRPNPVLIWGLFNIGNMFFLLWMLNDMSTDRLLDRRDVGFYVVVGGLMILSILRVAFYIPPVV